MKHRQGPSPSLSLAPTAQSCLLYIWKQEEVPVCAWQQHLAEHLRLLLWMPIKAKLCAVTNTAEIGSRFGGQNFASMSFVVVFFFKVPETRKRQCGLACYRKNATYFKKRQQTTDRWIDTLFFNPNECVAKTKSSKYICTTLPLHQNSWDSRLAPSDTFLDHL